MAATELCASCHEPLFLDVEPDSDFEESGTGAGSSAAGATSVPDDVELSCGCHYHWECIIEAYSVTQCPSCSRDISSISSTTGQQQVLCTVRNEGGVQESFDILPLAQEEAYLRTYPEERRGHAFLEFCKEGDVDAIVHLIKDPPEEEEDEEEDGGKEIDVLRYCGSFGAVDGSGLHVAIVNGREDVAWLLLFLASELDLSVFQAHNVLEAAQGLGLGLEDRSPRPDIRTLKNGEGLTAADLAEKLGGKWISWIEKGLLRP